MRSACSQVHVSCPVGLTRKVSQHLACRSVYLYSKNQKKGQRFLPLSQSGILRGLELSISGGHAGEAARQYKVSTSSVVIVCIPKASHVQYQLLDLGS